MQKKTAVFHRAGEVEEQGVLDGELGGLALYEASYGVLGRQGTVEGVLCEDGVADLIYALHIVVGELRPFTCFLSYDEGDVLVVLLGGDPVDPEVFDALLTGRDLVHIVEVLAGGNGGEEVRAVVLAFIFYVDLIGAGRYRSDCQEKGGEP